MALLWACQLLFLAAPLQAVPYEVVFRNNPGELKLSYVREFIIPSGQSSGRIRFGGDSAEVSCATKNIEIESKEPLRVVRAPGEGEVSLFRDGAGGGGAGGSSGEVQVKLKYACAGAAPYNASAWWTPAPHDAQPDIQRLF